MSLAETVVTLLTWATLVVFLYHFAPVLHSYWRAAQARGTSKPSGKSVSFKGETAVAEPVESGDAAEELKKVAELKRRVMQNGNAEKLPGGTRWYDDIEILRFVRARKTLDDSEGLFENFIASRLQQNGRLGIRMVNGSFGASYAQCLSNPDAAPLWWSFLQSKGWQMLFGVDKRGNPITYTGLGPADFNGCEREVGLEAVTLFFVMMNDRFLDEARRQSQGGRVVDAKHGGYSIVDLKGLGVRHFREVAVLRKLGEIANVVLPERALKQFVINAPSIFARFFSMAKPAIHPRTQAKIHVIGINKPLDPIFEAIGRENVPDFLGGTLRGFPEPARTLVQPGSYAEWQEQHRARAASERISPSSADSGTLLTSRKRRCVPKMFGLEPCCGI